MEATYELIMLDKPILVNEEHGELNDFVTDGTRIAQINVLTIDDPNKHKCRKILAGHEGAKRLTFQLSDEDAKRIGYFDVDKLAKKLIDDEFEDYEDFHLTGIAIGIKKGLSLTPKKYTAEQAMKIFYLARRGKDFDSVFEEVDKPSQFKVECTETENEITITKIL